ncbi:MAG: DUF1361 domain-containing protein [Anaeromicrobium sp.]|jgi:uncharacterized membrane protein|uniref:DUF1361 domain-containing protein n=1 Tax=Anaeromicrobium sp. TaxID=1929132 RepID=UPI0025E188F2|nr:DUF1361 domain-containing protein [Anaeromicrobium sp.]MCT4595863.1 DUF1361 domain-containing protein [Anaeromicrobium sp.]
MTLIDRPIMTKHTKILIGINFFLSALGSALVMSRVVDITRITYVYLIWNLILAWISLIASIVLNYIYEKRRRGRGNTLGFFLGLAWFFFYPNAPYMITDLIHISRINFYNSGGVNTNLNVWFDFLLNLLFISIGFLVGFISLYIIHRLVEKRIGKFTGWLFVLGVQFTCGYGIYLGRFPRLNSWYIVTEPLSVVKSITQTLNKETFIFTSMFSSFLILSYIVLYYLTYVSAESR